MERRLEASSRDTLLVFRRVCKGQPGQPVQGIARQWANALKEALLPAGRG
jgi:hypothetical protein